MAVLPDQDRADLWAAYMQEQSTEHSPIVALSKADIRAAVNAADAWAEANAAAYNAALPTAARNNLTQQQKARLLLWVVRRRWEVS
jgi:hypothetical protein